MLRLSYVHSSYNTEVLWDGSFSGFMQAVVIVRIIKRLVYGLIDVVCFTRKLFIYFTLSCTNVGLFFRFRRKQTEFMESTL